MLDRLASQFLPEMGAWLPLLEVLTTEGFAIRWSGRAHSLSLAGCRAFTADLKRTIYRSGSANHCHRLSPGFTEISVTNSTRQRHFDREHKAWAWISWHFFFFFDLCDKTLLCKVLVRLFTAHKLWRIPNWRDPHWLGKKKRKKERKSCSRCSRSKRGRTQAKCCSAESAQQSPFDEQDWQRMF